MASLSAGLAPFSALLVLAAARRSIAAGLRAEDLVGSEHDGADGRSGKDGQEHVSVEVHPDKHDQEGSGELRAVKDASHNLLRPCRLYRPEAELALGPLAETALRLCVTVLVLVSGTAVAAVARRRRGVLFAELVHGRRSLFEISRTRRLEDIDLIEAFFGAARAAAAVITFAAARAGCRDGFRQRGRGGLLCRTAGRRAPPSSDEGSLLRRACGRNEATVVLAAQAAQALNRDDQEEDANHAPCELPAGLDVPGRGEEARVYRVPVP